MTEDKLLTNHVLWDYLKLIKNIGEQLLVHAFVLISDLKHVALNFIQVVHISLSSWLASFLKSCSLLVDAPSPEDGRNMSRKEEIQIN